MRYYVLLILFCVIWALKDVFVKVFLDSIDPIPLTFYLSLFSTFFALILLLTKRARNPEQVDSSRFDRQTIMRLGLVSLLTAVGFLTLIYAIDFGSPILFALADSSAYPLFVASLAYLVLEESFPKSTLYGLTFAIAGILIFQITDIRTLSFQLSWGFPLTLLTSFLFALALTVTKHLLDHGITPEEILFYRFLISDFFLFLFLAYSGGLSVDLHTALKIAILALVGYTVPFYMSFYSLQEVPASLYGLFSVSIPIFSFVFTLILIPNSVLLSSQILGGLFIVAGLIVSVLPTLGQNKMVMT